MNIAILGCGTVATGTIKLLQNNRQEIIKTLGEEITIRKVMDLYPDKVLSLGFPKEVYCSSLDEILADESISLIVELIGGTTAAYSFITRALKAGRHIVTANKDLIALYSKELDTLAGENNVFLMYEASVAGGIPLLGPLRRTLAANKIQSIYGILNGTTNYILSHMTKDGSDYLTVLKQAQELGFAEANPASDVGGADAARKVAILASLAFHTRVTYPQVHHEGITTITEADIRFARQEGYVPKLLGVTREINGSVVSYVRPALVPESHPLASVNEAYNAVYLVGDPVEKVMLYGKGAGAGPTASSVAGDIMEICRRLRREGTARDDLPFYEDKPLMDITETVNLYYVRILAADKPKVLAGIAGAFGDHDISIESLVQEPRKNGYAELMILTHAASEASLQATIYDLMQREYIKEVNTMIVLEEEE